MMDFDQIIDRSNTECIKWQHYHEDVLPMWVADMDFRSPEPVIKALHERVDHGIFGYGCPPDGLFEAIVSHLETRIHWTVPESDLSLISGVVTGFTHAIYSLTEPGDRVLIQTPVYPPFLSAPKSAGRECLHSELIRQDDGHYEIDFDDFEEKISSDVKLFILCNPHNPVGKVFSVDELTRMGEICLKYGTLICSDDIHMDFVYPGKVHTPIASLAPEISEKTVTYFAPSKTFNVAGFSTSVYIAQNPDMRQHLNESMHYLLGHPNILGLHAARAAYKDGGPWLDALLVYLEENRDFLVEFVSEKLPGIKMWRPEGTYLGWLDCRSLDLDVHPCEFFLKEANVALNDGCQFGDNGQGFVRINFGCPRGLLLEGLQRMGSALEKINH
jgi:cystathionine beta-lyase